MAQIYDLFRRLINVWMDGNHEVSALVLVELSRLRIVLHTCLYTCQSSLSNVIPFLATCRLTVSRLTVALLSFLVSVALQPQRMPSPFARPPQQKIEIFRSCELRKLVAPT
jgi:hypothetical protein